VTDAPLLPADVPGERRSRGRDFAPSARLTIGALSRATGIPVETLRTWESRYGFPEPERKPSGHRLYPAALVPRLRRIAAALARGHRASECVPASDDELDALLGTSSPGTFASESEPLPAPGEDLGPMLEAVSTFDADRLTRMLLGEWARLGPMEFLTRRVAPLVHLVGDQWRGGQLQITHEHFLSERLADILRTVRLPFDARASGPLVVCATLPGERHALGLQMAALVAAVEGWRVLYLGTEVPPEQVVSTALEAGARVVALSVSSATSGPASLEMLSGLRRELPARVPMLVGGQGAPPGSPGIEALGDFERFRHRLATMSTN